MRVYLVPPGFKSDGCTIPLLLNVVTVGLLFLLMRPFRDACRWHDFARRHLVHHKVLTVASADMEFRRQMAATTWWAPPIAYLAWAFVVATRGMYRRSEPIPGEWARYLTPSNTAEDPV